MRIKNKLLYTILGISIFFIPQFLTACYKENRRANNKWSVFNSKIFHLDFAFNAYRCASLYNGYKKILSGCATLAEGYSGGYPFRDFIWKPTDYAPLSRPVLNTLPSLINANFTFANHVLHSKPAQDLTLIFSGLNKIVQKTMSSFIPNEKKWYKDALKYSKIALGLGASYYFYTNSQEHQKAYCGAALLFAADSYFNNSIQKSFYFPFTLIGFKSL